MTNIFSELKNMNHQLSNALSTMFLRRLDIFLHSDTHVLQNPQKGVGCEFPIYQLGFFPHIYHNENLFRSIGLCKNLIVRIDFSCVLTNLEIFPQNHSADFGHFGQNAQNRFLNIKIFIFFQENDIGLERAQRYRLSIPNNGFFI